VQQDTYIELLLGGIAAAMGCLLVMLLVLLLSAQSRQLTVARTATMGLSMAQGRWLTLVESTPQFVAVLIGGLICALGLAPLVGPALDLAAFTGSATPVPVRIEPAWLAVTAIGLLVLAMATVSIQTMLADREVPRSLRIGG
jgi:putative ABC transport system permease protein